MMLSSSRARIHIFRRNLPNAKGAEAPERDGCLTHVNAAQHIEHEPERYAAHGCHDAITGCIMRRRADRILEVAEMDARLRLRLVMALLSSLLRGEKRAEYRILCGRQASGLYQLLTVFENVSTESSNEMSLCSITKRLYPDYSRVTWAQSLSLSDCPRHK